MMSKDCHENDEEGNPEEQTEEEESLESSNRIEIPPRGVNSPTTEVFLEKWNKDGSGFSFRYIRTAKKKQNFGENF